MKTEEIMKILEENKITNVHKKKEKKMSNQLFWKRSAILYNAWKQAEHKDMKNIWYWKLIDLMKIMPNKKCGLE